MTDRYRTNRGRWVDVDELARRAGHVEEAHIVEARRDPQHQTEADRRVAERARRRRRYHYDNAERRRRRRELVAIGIVVGLALYCLYLGAGGAAWPATAHAAGYRPAVGAQDEAAISCGGPIERELALRYTRQMTGTVVRINAIENMDAFYGCDPIGAARAVAARGFEPYVTVQGTARYARRLGRILGPIVDRWSVWNEPNHSGFWYGPMADGAQTTYLRLFVRASRAIRGADPGSCVMFGEVAPQGTYASYAKKVSRRGRRPVRACAFAIHAYIWYQEPSHSDGLAGYLARTQRSLRRLAKTRDFCRPERTRRLARRRCRPVPIAITESGYMRETNDANRWAHGFVFGQDRLDADYPAYWAVACQYGVKIVIHYNVIDSHEPSWDTALIGEHGPRPEFPVLVGYLRSAKSSCAGIRGQRGAYGPPPASSVNHPIVTAPPPPLAPEAPDDTTVTPDAPPYDPTPETTPPDTDIELPGPPEPTPELPPVEAPPVIVDVPVPAEPPADPPPQGEPPAVEVEPMP